MPDLSKALKLTVTERLERLDDLQTIASTIEHDACDAHRDAITRLIDAGYADTPLRVIERLAREMAELQEHP